ncbi:hypothetical protein RV-Ds10_gp2 [Rotavirus D chicken/05V0049/DEU/2005]|uniref:Uncharacterized protein n=1 Tax=Rotavirus D chicken/05V0049/DEU/2005 TaxID=884200 RepID=E2EBU9_9REOV|nr:hypothetical protein RV-Ds10_gp2 [Rotavirus D chicken/05V0049/DEU/2005]ADN06433.1 hypothetical protein [Rotavirus D chicken/05V0049/DEU/2005]
MKQSSKMYQVEIDQIAKHNDAVILTSGNMSFNVLPDETYTLSRIKLLVVNSAVLFVKLIRQSSSGLYNDVVVKDISYNNSNSLTMYVCSPAER